MHERRIYINIPEVTALIPRDGYWDLHLWGTTQPVQLQAGDGISLLRILEEQKGVKVYVSGITTEIVTPSDSEKPE